MTAPAARPVCRYCRDTGFVSLTRATASGQPMQIRVRCDHTRWSPRP